MSEFLSIGNEMKKLDKERPYEEKVKKILTAVGLENHIKLVNSDLSNSKLTLERKIEIVDILEKQLEEIKPGPAKELQGLQAVGTWSEWYIFHRIYPPIARKEEPPTSGDGWVPSGF